MAKCLLVGGRVIWPLLLSSVAARAILSLATAYRPAGGEDSEEQAEVELEALMCALVNLVQGKKTPGAGLLTAAWTEREVAAAGKRSPTLADMRKTVFG